MMILFLELLMAAALCTVLFCAVVVMKSFTDEPAPKRGGGAVYTVITADGSAEHLQETITAALRLRETGAMRSHILIVDIGLAEKPRRIAELMARDSGVITLCSPDDVPIYITQSE